MIHLMFSALIGGFATSALLWPSSAILAIALAPVGGSLAAAAAAVLVALQASRSQATVTANTPDLDRQIAALRALAAQGRRSPAHRDDGTARNERAA